LAARKDAITKAAVPTNADQTSQIEQVRAQPALHAPLLDWGGVIDARVRNGAQSISSRSSRRCRQHRLGIGGSLERAVGADHGPQGRCEPSAMASALPAVSEPS